MRACCIMLASVALCLLRGNAAAQQSDVAPVVGAALVRTVADLSDGRLGGTLAFDPRIVRPARERAQGLQADSVVPVWAGNRRDSVFTASTVEMIFREAASAGSWVTCAPESATCPCTSRAFPLVAAVSEPWIEGDRAQLIVFVMYRSSIQAHPHAWFANLVQLRRMAGRWTVQRVFNQAGT